MLTTRQRKTKLKFRRDILNIGRCAWSVLMIWAGFLLHGLLTVSNTIDLQSSEMVIEVSKNRPTLAKETHWCIVASKFLPKNTRAHFSHFPHAAEIILPCWSYFMEQEATGNCGFYFANEKQFQLSPWPKDLIQAMGCEVKYPSPGKGMDKKGFVDELPKNDVQFIPNTYLLRPRLEYIRYLNSPSHAHALRRLKWKTSADWNDPERRIKKNRKFRRNQGRHPRSYSQCRHYLYKLSIQYCDRAGRMVCNKGCCRCSTRGCTHQLCFCYTRNNNHADVSSRIFLAVPGSID